MYSALYYPHTKIRSESVLKTALLLWDEIHTIIPWSTYRIEPGPALEMEAHELIGRSLSPSDSEKQELHRLVENFVDMGLPSAFYIQDEHEDEDLYEMFKQKMMRPTWQLLLREGLARPVRGRETHVATRRPTGLALMSLLADCCAGNTLARVTDRGSAYASLAGLFIDELSEEPSRVRKLFPDLERTETYTRLTPIALEVVDPNQFSLESLIKLRKSELRAGGHHLRNLRHKFSDHLSEQAMALASAKTERDVEEIKRSYRLTIHDSYASLKDALKLKTSEVLTSREVFASVLVAGSMLASPHLPNLSATLNFGAAGSLLSGILSKTSQFAQSRTEMLQKQPTAYLYEASQTIRGWG